MTEKKNAIPTQCLVLDTPAVLGLAERASLKTPGRKKRKASNILRKDSCDERKGLTWPWSLLVFSVILEHMKNLLSAISSNPKVNDLWK